LIPKKKSKGNQVIGEWHEEQLDEVDLEDQMEGLFPMHEYVKNPPVVATPLGRLLMKKSVSAQPSMSSLGDIADGGHLSSLSKVYPPNQEGYMRRHKTNLSDTETSANFFLFFICLFHQY
jgi:hypothetical protein